MSHAANRSADTAFLRGLLTQYARALDTDVIAPLIAVRDQIRAARDAGRKVIFAGNGASAAISSHAAVDFTKTAAVRAINFNEADLITCFANDYGYEHWIARALEAYADPGDIVVLVSSSGRSPNVVKAAEYSRTRGLGLVTLTGFDHDNPLRGFGAPALWVDSRSYNVVESTHQVWLLLVCDLLAAEVETARGR